MLRIYFYKEGKQNKPERQIKGQGNHAKDSRQESFCEGGHSRKAARDERVTGKEVHD